MFNPFGQTSTSGRETRKREQSLGMLWSATLHHCSRLTAHSRSNENKGRIIKKQFMTFKGEPNAVIKTLSVGNYGAW